MSQFAFLAREWASVFEAASQAEAAVHADPRTALAGFLAGRALTGSQLEFVNLIVDHLTEHDVVEPRRLYESPFTDVTPSGPEGLFDEAAIDQLVAVLDDIRQTAIAA
jgi:type I restriction enzyme R subunit